MDGQVRFKSEWESEDGNLSPTFRTMKVLEGTMVGIIKGLEMTMETKEDFDGKWLPTLDVSLSISSNNRLEFKHYEKPMCSNVTLQKSSAMEQNTKMGILSNEVMRRLFNIGGEIMDKERGETLDRFAVKLLTSGFQVETSRKIILAGIRGYEAKVKKRNAENVPIYRTAEESGKTRNRKKIIGKSSWFKGGNGKKTTQRWNNTTNMKRNNGGVRNNAKVGKDGTSPLMIKTRTVLFVEHTPGGELAKRLRDQLSRLEGLMGFKIKVVERTGTALKDLFSLSDVWNGGACSREDFTTCRQGFEEIPDCTRRSIIYESICKKCIPDAMKPGPVGTPKTKTPCIYVGESSCSMYERAGEHWKAYKQRKPDSHIWKHHLVHHNGEGEPEMVFKMVGKFKTALTRQVTEAVTIRRRGIMALNSKSEYDRCKIHRLTVGEEQEGTNFEEQEGCTPDGTQGEILLMEKRKQMDRQIGRINGKVSVTKSKKRDYTGKGEYISRPSKKRKYVLVGDDWGNVPGSADHGLECLEKDRTAPLPGKNYNQEERGNTVKPGPCDRDGTGPLQTTKDTIGVGSNVEVGIEAQNTDKGGPGPLLGKDTRKIDTTKSIQDTSAQNNTEVMKNNTERSSMSMNNTVEDALYDTAWNVKTIRDLKGTCKVKKMYCVEHDLPATRTTRKEKVWTRIAKTGLYGYRTRKVSVVACSGHTKTLVPTMDQLDGVGEQRAESSGEMTGSAISV